jgi:transposase
VQPLLSSWARRSEDLTVDKTDEKDAVLIARLTAQLRCYVPEPVDETWGRLRHLGARREQLIASIVSQVQQIRALLECVWPAALEFAQQLFRSPTWAAATSVIFDRDGGDLNRTRRLGSARFEQAMRREIIKRGGQQACRRIVRKLFTALADSAGVLDHRRGALERVQLMLTDWVEDQRRLTDTEARMLAVLDQLQLTELVTSIHGVSAIRGCGDPGRDRRPAPVRIRPGPGQTRRPRARGKNCLARSPAAPNSPDGAAPVSGWPPGASSGVRCKPTPSTPPATDI